MDAHISSQYWKRSGRKSPMQGTMKVLDGHGHSVLALDKPDDLEKAYALASSGRGTVFDAKTQEKVKFDPSEHPETIFVPQMAGGA
jgi:hypothetical protein